MSLEAVVAQFRGYTIVLRMEFRLDRVTGQCDLEIDLAKDEREDADAVSLEFLDVSELSLNEFGGGVTQLLYLQLTDVSDRQLERKGIWVEELERNSIKFYCKSARAMALSP